MSSGQRNGLIYEALIIAGTVSRCSILVDIGSGSTMSFLLSLLLLRHFFHLTSRREGEGVFHCICCSGLQILETHRKDLHLKGILWIHCCHCASLLFCVTTNPPRQNILLCVILKRDVFVLKDLIVDYSHQISGGESLSPLSDTSGQRSEVRANVVEIKHKYHKMQILLKFLDAYVGPLYQNDFGSSVLSSLGV